MRCSMKACETADELAERERDAALRDDQRQQHEQADREDSVKSSVSASARPPKATPSPAAASEPERISQRVPMTSVS